MTKKMTEQEFIKHFKRKGFTLYKTSEINKVYKSIEKIEREAQKITKPNY